MVLYKTLYEHQLLKERSYMNANLVKEIGAKQLREGIPTFKAGDTVKVYVKIKEGAKDRIQPYEGVVVSRRGEGTDATFIVRKISANSVGVERVFPLHSPLVEKIEVLKVGRVRRAKLYYIRELRGKKARIKEEKK
jgi:large subunit ribosomal protein L19